MTIEKPEKKKKLTVVTPNTGLTSLPCLPSDYSLLIPSSDMLW